MLCRGWKTRDSFQNIVVDGRSIQDHFPGVARYTFNLVTALVRLRPDVDWTVVYHPGSRNRRYDLNMLPRLGVRLVASSARPFSLAEQVRLPLEVRRWRPAVSHLPYTVRPYAWPAPVVATVHDVIPVIFPEGFSVQQRALFRLTMSLHVRLARRVIAVSAATRADLLRHFRVPAERVVVIPEAVDAEFRPRPMEEVQAVRQRYHLPEHYLLYLGINKQHKNLVRLVEAYARLEPGVPALVLAGREDPRYPQARQRAAELGLAERVRFPGDIANADLPALYSGAMLFVFPSLYEGFGLPPLEAMACGTPVACSQASSLPEVVGEATLRFDPYDVEAIAQGLRQAVQDEPLRKHLGEAGVARAAQFTWERAARETMRVYDEVTG